jgi:4-hydroxy-2-oxoheptanedioate aldolase
MTSAPIRSRLTSGAIGFWLTLPATVSAEKVAHLGYDFLGLDLQHGQSEYRDALGVLGAVGSTGIRLIARVPANEAWWIGRVLDAGAAGVIVPMINDAAEARRAVAACRYPPLGERSYGPLRSGMYIGPDPEVANEVVACIVMIETTRGLANVEEIASVPGVDGLFVGPSDLAISLGLKPGVTGNARFDESMARIRTAASNAGIAVGLPCPSGAQVRRRFEEGFTFAFAATDLNLIVAGAEAELAAARSGGPALEVPASLGLYGESPTTALR